MCRARRRSLITGLLLLTVCACSTSKAHSTSGVPTPISPAPIVTAAPTAGSYSIVRVLRLGCDGATASGLEVNVMIHSPAHEPLVAASFSQNDVFTSKAVVPTATDSTAAFLLRAVDGQPAAVPAGELTVTFGIADAARTYRLTGPSHIVVPAETEATCSR
jgi:hypothetical protein